ncbi:adenylate kinase [Gonapodya sp. JEL0774]|nr:adenylate kinase [Gonapodya sp. JEL0774]
MSPEPGDAGLGELVEAIEENEDSSDGATSDIAAVSTGSAGQPVTQTEPEASASDSSAANPVPPSVPTNIPLHMPPHPWLALVPPLKRPAVFITGSTLTGKNQVANALGARLGAVVATRDRLQRAIGFECERIRRDARIEEARRMEEAKLLARKNNLPATGDGGQEESGEAGKEEDGEKAGHTDSPDGSQNPQDDLDASQLVPAPPTEPPLPPLPFPPPPSLVSFPHLSISSLARSILASAPPDAPSFITNPPTLSHDLFREWADAVCASRDATDRGLVVDLGEIVTGDQLPSANKREVASVSQMTAIEAPPLDSSTTTPSLPVQALMPISSSTEDHHSQLPFLPPTLTPFLLHLHPPSLSSTSPRVTYLDPITGTTYPHSLVSATQAHYCRLDAEHDAVGRDDGDGVAGDVEAVEEAGTGRVKKARGGDDGEGGNEENDTIPGENEEIAEEEWEDDAASVLGDRTVYVALTQVRSSATHGDDSDEQQPTEDTERTDPDPDSGETASGLGGGRGLGDAVDVNDPTLQVPTKRTNRFGVGGMWKALGRDVVERLVALTPPSSSLDESPVPTLPHLPVSHRISLSSLQHPRRTARATVAFINAVDPSLGIQVRGKAVVRLDAGEIHSEGEEGDGGGEGAPETGSGNAEGGVGGKAEGESYVTDEKDPAQGFGESLSDEARQGLARALGTGISKHIPGRKVACDGWDIVERKKGKRVRGKVGLALGWRGSAFFFSSERTLAAFSANPDHYLASTLAPSSGSSTTLDQVRICVTGTNPLIPSLCRSLASAQGITFVDVREVVGRWRQRGTVGSNQKDATMETSGEQPPSLPGSLASLNMDTSSPQFLSSVLKEVLKSLKEQGKGWVIAGFPATQDEAKLVAQEGVHMGTVVWWAAPAMGGNAVDSRPGAETDVKEAIDSKLRDGWTTVLAEAPLPAAAHRALRATAVGWCDAADGVKCVLPEDMWRRVPGGKIGTEEDDGNTEEENEDGGLIQLGPTGVCCPVRLRAGHVVRGKPSHAVRWRGLTWFCAGEPEQMAATNAPEEFLARPPAAVPTRVCVVGTIGSGVLAAAQWIVKRDNGGEGAKVVEFNDSYLAQIVASVSDKSEKETFAAAVRDTPHELPEALVRRVVDELFARPTGFVITGFPRNETEVTALLEGGRGVDCVVHLTVERDIACSREVPQKVEEAEAKVARARAEGSEREEGVDVTVVEEEVGEAYDKDAESVDSVISAFARLATVPVLEVDANRCERVVSALLEKTAGAFLVGRRNMLACPTPVDPLMVTEAVRTGAVAFSEMGLYDPVTVIQNLETRKKEWIICQHQFHPFVDLALFEKSQAKKIPSEDNEEAQADGESEEVIRPSKSDTPTACLLGSRVFVFHNEANLDLFCREPFRFSNFADAFQGVVNETELFSITPPVNILGDAPPHAKVAASGALGIGALVLGGAKANETAMKVAQDLGLEYLTVEFAVSDILDMDEAAEEDKAGKRIKVPEQSDLRDRVAAAVAADCLDDDLKVEIIMEVVKRSRPAMRGWVLSGFPTTIIQAQLLEEAAITPQLIVEITDADETTSSTQSLATIRSFYTTRYPIWFPVPSSAPTWALRATISRRLVQILRNRSVYIHRTSVGWAAGIHDCGSAVRLDEVPGKVDRRYGKCCAVTFLRDGELEICEGERWTVQYKGAYFRTKGPEEMEVFLSDPTKFVENYRSVPETLPLYRSRTAVKSQFPKEIEMQGYCPVTFVENTSDPFAEGSLDLVVEFNGKLYSMESPEKLTMFMRKPWLYTNFRPPSKLPPKKIVLPLSQLPMAAYLERTVVSAVTSAISSAGKTKPKFPYKSLEASAAQYMALYLKANNPSAKPWVRSSHQAQLDSFRHICGVTSELASRTQRLSYVPEDKRERGIDEKIESIVRLQPVTKRLVGMRPDSN